MNDYIFNIACYDRSTQVPKIIKAVFNSVPIRLDIYKNTSDFGGNPSGYIYDLILINRINSKISKLDIKKYQVTNPDTDIIVIDKDLNIIDEWLDVRHLKLLTEKEIVQKLPVILGEIYSSANEKLVTGFNYFDLLKNSLKIIDKIVILADESGDLVFLNHNAEQFLGLENQEYAGQSLKDCILDGAKVWSFIFDRCLVNNEKVEGYKTIFLDAQNAEKQAIVSAKRLSQNQNFILIQSDMPSEFLNKFDSPDQYELLDKFADSIANDLLNPVNIISGRIQMLSDGLKNENKYKKSFEALEKQVNRIEEVTSKMLAFARLKQDSVPQKIDLNSIFNKILYDTAIKSKLEGGQITLSSSLAEPLPILQGLIGHFDLLIRTILEVSFTCLGQKGAILVETEHISNYLNRYWVGLRINLEYSESVYTKKENLYKYLGNDSSETQIVTIETTIIDHIIRHYQGNYQLHRDGQTKETIVLLFPVPESKH